MKTFWLLGGLILISQSSFAVAPNMNNYLKSEQTAILCGSGQTQQEQVQDLNERLLKATSTLEVNLNNGRWITVRAPFDVAWPAAKCDGGPICVILTQR